MLSYLELVLVELDLCDLAPGEGNAGVEPERFFDTTVSGYVFLILGCVSYGENGKPSPKKYIK